MLERVALLHDGPSLDADALGLEPVGAPAAGAGLEAMTLDQAEAWLLQRAVEVHRGNLQRAANQLGISRQSLYRRLAKHGIEHAGG